MVRPAFCSCIHPDITKLLGASSAPRRLSEFVVVHVPNVTFEEFLQAINAGAPQFVPHTPSEQRFGVGTVSLPDVRGCPLLSEEVVGANLHPAFGAATEIHVKSFGNFVTLHALTAVDDICIFVLPHRRRVNYWIVRLVVHFNSPILLVDALHARRVAATASRGKATFEALLKVLSARGKAVDHHWMNMYGPRNRRVVKIFGSWRNRLACLR